MFTIDSYGLAVTFPIAVGLALVIGVVVNYLAAPVGDATLLFAGLLLVVAAIIIDGLAYRRMQQSNPAA